MTPQKIKNYAELLKELREGIDYINMQLVSFEYNRTNIGKKRQKLLFFYYKAFLKILKKV